MIDINPYHLEMVTQILHQHVPDCEVRAFGSRATWTSRDYSDLDLAIVGNGPLKWRTLGKLRDAFQESYLPFRVDVLDWHDISDNFRKIIEADCITVLESKKITNFTKSKPPTRAFGDCATLIRASVDPASVGDIPYIGLEHIGEGTLSLLDHGVASDVTSTKTLFKQGDILFGKLRPYFRKVIRAPFDGICSTDIWTVRAKEGIDQGYLYYCMASQPFVDFATSGSIGTRMPRAKWEYVSQYSLPIPTLSEQREIAHILESLDDKIELNRRMNETLEAIAQALFKSWFVDFDPVRAKMEGRWRPGESLPGLPAHLYDLFPDRLVSSELINIPEGWQHIALNEVLEINPVRSLKRGTVAPYLSMANMPTKGHVPHTITEDPFGSGVRFINGDTLVARITPCLENGKVAYVDFLQKNEIGWGSTEYIVMRPALPLPNEYAYLLARTNTFISFAVKNMHGTSGRQRVSGDAISNYRITLPNVSSPIMKTFGEIVQNIFLCASKNAQEFHILTILRNALLQKLLLVN